MRTILLATALLLVPMVTVAATGDETDVMVRAAGPESVQPGGGPELAKDDDAGYLPDRPHPQSQAAGQPSFDMQAPTPPLRFGVNLGLGSHIPITGDVDLIDGRREFTGTFDFGGALFFALHNMLQLDIVARGGFGGVSADLYEERYRYSELQARHLWLGGHARFFPIDFGGLQPFASVQIGTDRVFAARMEGTGAYECTDNGWTIRCEEEEERTFAAGYWGGSLGLGAGLRFAGAGSPLAFTAEGMWMRNHYGVRTETNASNQRLADASPTTWNLGLLFQVHLHLN
jgi:hypothetical protein